MNFAKYFCWLVIWLRPGEGMGRGQGGMWASDPIKCNIIIKRGRERNREKVAKNEKKSVNLDGN